ncbi:TPA: hypothetical protein H1005_02565 [archaeon]|nr:hypothetical protein [Candidatus Naiadarchaeales archaeon SRR2090153.bin1042]
MMGGKGKENASVVKIDSVLLEKVDQFIAKEENKYKFVNKKQFIDLAVNSFLYKMKGSKRDD